MQVAKMYENAWKFCIFMIYALNMHLIDLIFNICVPIATTTTKLYAQSKNDDFYFVRSNQKQVHIKSKTHTMKFI